MTNNNTKGTMGKNTDTGGTTGQNTRGTKDTLDKAPNVV